MSAAAVFTVPVFPKHAFTEQVGTPHDVSPESALAALKDYDGPILLDFDETLYLRNSTEDFIDAARPQVLALVLMRMLDIVKPWRWTGGEATRDVWRVRLIYMCFPWTGWRWRKSVARLATHFSNRRLVAAAKTSRSLPIIATAGFETIVRPLVAALGLPHARIAAARLWNFDDRRAGKLQRTVNVLGGETVRRALVLTDSADDLKLLDACACPLRVVWPEAHRRNALSGVYLPGQYLTHIKRPGARYIVRGILQEDFAFWVLSSIALAALPVLHVLGLLFLSISFWSIYERGYVDNDLIAARFEASPKLSAQFWESPVATPRWQPWIWGVACGAIAVVLLRRPSMASATDFAAWIGVLLGTHFLFALYNRFDKATRTWMFMGLQIARSTALIALVPIAPIGAIALGAHVLARWVPYYAYRLGGKDWPEAPFHLIRLMFFVVLALLLGVSAGRESVVNWTALCLLVWNLYRSRRELVAAIAAARRLDRTDAQSR